MFDTPTDTICSADYERAGFMVLQLAAPRTLLCETSSVRDVDRAPQRESVPDWHCFSLARFCRLSALGIFLIFRRYKFLTELRQAIYGNGLNSVQNTSQREANEILTSQSQLTIVVVGNRKLIHGFSVR